ncbi:hypothetical protein [Propionivibrio sp.]|uniref:hypothetical protein n=1 Tax=Propionivibrio sp. TaxID=2212460 RepID=UPI00260DE836|nr:hypothetical protein [Propionivibrio sp.]
MYLLDTNVVSKLRKPRPHGAVVAWIESIADTDIYHVLTRFVYPYKPNALIPLGYSDFTVS